MRIAGGIELFSDPGSRTGLSAVAGKPVEAASDLPGFHVEVHLFQNADSACAFVAGLEAAGPGNALVYDHATGMTEGNRTVIVGRLDVLRRKGANVEEAIEVKVHGPSGLDGKAHAASMDRIQREREKDRIAQAEAVAPVRAALPGACDEEWGRGWYRASFEGFNVTVSWGRDSGIYRVTTGFHGLFEGPLDLTEVLRAVVKESGFDLDAEDRELGMDGVLAGDLAGCVRRMAETERTCMNTREKAYHQDFVSRTKMTAARRRFLVAGYEGLILFFVNRGSMKARAGGEEIGPSEIAVMEKMGWVARSGSGLAVTEAGSEAAREHPKRKIKDSVL